MPNPKQKNKHVMKAQDKSKPIGWEYVLDCREWEFIPYKLLPPQTSANDGICFKQEGPYYF
jgi:hypothetical protein